MVRPPYQVTYRLYAIAGARWAEIDAAYASVDLIRFPAHRFLNCVWAWCLARVPGDKVEEWIIEMNAPLPGQKREVSEVEAEIEGRGFMEVMAQHQQMKAGAR